MNKQWRIKHWKSSTAQFLAVKEYIKQNAFSVQKRTKSSPKKFTAFFDFF
jgi:hypothetical protein